jgi:hypothetical protein
MVQYLIAVIPQAKRICVREVLAVPFPGSDPYQA